MAEQNYVGIMLDCPGSMGSVLEEVKSALLKILEIAEKNKTPLAIWAFAGWEAPAARPVVPFGLNKATAAKQIKNLHVGGWTTFTPAFEEICQEMVDLDGRRTLIVILDGQVSDPQETQKALAAYGDRVEVIALLLSSGFNSAEIARLQNHDTFSPQFRTLPAEELVQIVGELLTEAAK
jgi:Mg-chelatase subunit ChlD